MNFIFISPNFPDAYWNFCDRLRKNGMNVLGIGDAPYDSLNWNLKRVLTEYYRVDTMENYGEVFRAVAFFSFKYGKINWIESNNEYWLELDARLRADFNVTTGVQANQIAFIKEKHLMKEIYFKNNIPTARQHRVAALPLAREFIDKVGYPVIVKPDIGVGANNTYKLCDDSDLERFYSDLPKIPYVMEEFIEGNIHSYDAIVDSRGEPLFESSSVFPPSIMDIVVNKLDLAYYTAADVPEPLRALGRKTVKAFGVASRFVHLEFFCLTKKRKNLGDVGDYVALEVNMRPAGGYTPDMMNYAHSQDVYQIWADMVCADKIIHETKDRHHYCAYASRRDGREYLHSHDEIMREFGERITLHEEMPRISWPQMGRWMYIAKAQTLGETQEFIDFVEARKN